MLLVAAAGFSLAIALAVWAVVSQAQERAVIRSSLRQLDGYDAPVDSVREQELLTNWLSGATDTRTGRRFTLGGTLAKMGQASSRLLPTGLFDPAVLDPAVDCLFALARGGAVLEFAIGTGRLALPLSPPRACTRAGAGRRRRRERRHRQGVPAGRGQERRSADGRQPRGRFVRPPGPA